MTKRNKVSLVYKDSEDRLQIETVWASPEGAYFRVENTPFFAKNVAFGDLISVEEDGGHLFFEDLVEASGHSTLHVVVKEKGTMDSVAEDLVALGCDWEGSHLPGYFSVDVPKSVDYAPVRSYLMSRRELGGLDFAEACLADDHRAEIG